MGTRKKKLKLTYTELVKEARVKYEAEDSLFDLEDILVALQLQLDNLVGDLKEAGKLDALVYWRKEILKDMAKIKQFLRDEHKADKIEIHNHYRTPKD